VQETETETALGDIVEELAVVEVDEVVEVAVEELVEVTEVA